MKNVIWGIAAAILALVFATGVGLAFIHVSDLPYVVDVDKLEISETSGLPKEEILENYNATMKFLSPFRNRPFALPTLGYSEMGSYHFQQCKLFFNIVYAAALLSGFFLLLLGVGRRLTKRALQTGGFVSLAIPCFLGAVMAFNFDKVFVIFHSLFFDGSTWIFDPAVDEIINILPQEFFMHCGIIIACFWLAAAVIMLFAGYHKRKGLG